MLVVTVFLLAGKTSQYEDTIFFVLQLEKLEKFRKRQQPVEAETDEQNEVRKRTGREEGRRKKGMRGVGRESGGKIMERVKES